MHQLYFCLALVFINLASCFAHSNFLLGRDDSHFGELNQPPALDESSAIAFNEPPNENPSSDFLADDFIPLLLPGEDSPPDYSTDNLFDLAPDENQNSSLDLLASGSSSECPSPFLPSGKVRARGSEFCIDSNDSQSHGQSESSQPAAVSQEKVRDFWCGNQGILDFPEIPVCSSDREFFVPIERYARHDDILRSAPLEPGKVESGFTVVMHCHLCKSSRIIYSFIHHFKSFNKEQIN
jgi:hypothetical protein